ncbi:MAG: hypothetical protein HeimC2_02630 [Candidatus Heimdallarchaeota archaeon LC_2]|nr:MAG: hypothetical protein HeimC2_02630 [Candidatus Heimdallarchaeota archaeon LC_2]
MKQRARDLGLQLEGETGAMNAITDVDGVEVGHSTIIQGSGKLIRGQGPIRTGVTAILPKGKEYSKVFASWYSLNGNGEMTGTTWIEESGFLEGPIMITNTHSVGIVRDATIAWIVENTVVDKLNQNALWFLPVVAETFDGMLNDILGFHVTKEVVFEALNSSNSDNVQEGNVGGGTGMICHGFKGGIGTSSRVISMRYGEYKLGILVQANYGKRNNLTITGIPVGKHIKDLIPINLSNLKEKNENIKQETGSIIVVLATDAPLLPHQLKRLVKRIPIGLGRLGSYAGNGSGDIFIAFTTKTPDKNDTSGKPFSVQMMRNEEMDPLFLATIQATEEAIINSLLAAETMEGINGNTVFALPHEKLIETLKKFNRIKFPV